VSDSRTGKRFPLVLPISFKGEETKEESKASTANVSAAGVYIQTDSSLDIGTPIEFDIALPPDVTGAEHTVKVHCKGRVVRVEKAAGQDSAERNGIACVIDHYSFLRK
jgi:hypothetical protein